MLEIFLFNLQILFTILHRTCSEQILFLYVSVFMIIKSEIGGQNLNEHGQIFDGNLQAYVLVMQVSIIPQLNFFPRSEFRLFT